MISINKTKTCLNYLLIIVWISTMFSISILLDFISNNLSRSILSAFILSILLRLAAPSPERTSAGFEFYWVLPTTAAYLVFFIYYPSLWSISSVRALRNYSNLGLILETSWLTFTTKLSIWSICFLILAVLSLIISSTLIIDAFYMICSSNRLIISNCVLKSPLNPSLSPLNPSILPVT